MPSFLRRNLLGLSIRARLLFIQSLLILALSAVSVVAWHAIDQERHSGQVLAKLNRAQRLYLMADKMDDELEADGKSALLATGKDAQTAGEVLASLHEHTRRFDAALEALAQVDTDPDVALHFSNGFALQHTYVAAANEVVATALRDRAQGLAMESLLVKRFEAIQIADDLMSTRIAEAIEAAENDALKEASVGKTWIIVAGLLAALLAGTFVVVISASIRRSLQQICEAARALATGNLSVRSDVASDDEVGELAIALNKMADDLQHMVDRLLADASRDAFGTKLTQALEMADNEGDVHGLVARSMAEIDADLPMELLMAEASRPKLRRVTASPGAGAPGCGVQALSHCAAVRRGTPVTFEDSYALNACPRLRQDHEGPVSAICVPVGFMGKWMGVLHVVGSAKAPAARHQAAQLAILGAQTGARIGSLRALERARLHAYTDSLTGLSNRRALEPVIHDLAAVGATYAVVLADLDHFKSLNDSHGHEAGDRALRLFADILRRSVRDTDYAVRWGGEEFLLVLPGSTKEPIVEVVEKIRRDLAEAILVADAIPFTASFGIADSASSGMFDDVVRHADEALYESKQAGRNRATVTPSAKGGAHSGLARKSAPVSAAVPHHTAPDGHSAHRTAR